MFTIFTPNVPKVDVSAIKEAIDKNEDMILLDVRTPEEYVKNHIKNSFNIPVEEVAEKIEQLFPDKNKKIYVYCLSGSRSVYAVDTLLKLGYEKVYDMNNGLLAWRAKGYPL